MSALSTTFAQSPVPKEAKLETVVSGFQFVEGPMWKDGTLLFSDISGNAIYRWNPATGKTTGYLNPSNNSNGLALDKQGRIVFGQMGLRRVARIETDSSQTSLASSYNGEKLNSPNDVVVKSDGSIFFTDPDYNVPGGIQNKELSFCGIYRISPTGGLQLLDSTLQEPNGICFSPDETKLYVNDSGKRIIYVWNVVNDSTIDNKKTFAVMNTKSGNADGMKVDSSGDLFSAGPFGIWVFSPAGNVLDTILVPGQTTNCNWGDNDMKTLYITSNGTSGTIYRIRLASTTGMKNTGDNFHNPSFRLFPNFPNPFNPSTAISYQLSAVSHVDLKIFDVLGRSISTLADDIELPGLHEVDFNGDKLSSGIYFYRLTTENLTETKEMVLLK